MHSFVVIEASMSWKLEAAFECGPITSNPKLLNVDGPIGPEAYSLTLYDLELVLNPRPQSVTP